MIDVPAKDIKHGEFFATADDPPNNVWVMWLTCDVTDDGTGLCQNINTEEYYTIEPHGLVRRIDKTEYDRKVFHVFGPGVNPPPIGRLLARSAR